jgi:PPP family 3-phenylpropionic acid transporter
MSKEEISLSRLINAQLASVQASFWLSFVAIGGFSVVLLQSKNFTPSEIGILLALQSLASIVAQPILSGYADRHKRLPLKFMVVGMMFVSIIAFGLFHFVPHLMTPAIIIFVVMGMTYTSVPAFVNAIAMQLSNSGIRINYGLTRGLGSLAFALTGTLLGKLIDISGEVVIVPFFILSALLVCISLLWIKRPGQTSSSNTLSERSSDKTGSQESGSISVDVSENTSNKPSNLLTFLINNKVFTGFCLASGVLFISHTCINNFLPDIVTQLGGSVADQGLTRSISAACEFPIMFLYIFLSRRITSNKLLIFSALSFFLKALLTLIAPNMGVLYAVQLLQMPAFGLYTPAAVVFADSSVSDHERVRAQALAMASTFGIGNVLGNLGGGFVLDAFGLYPMLVFSSVTGFIGFLIMFFVLIDRRKKKSASVA